MQSPTTLNKQWVQEYNECGVVVSIFNFWVNSADCCSEFHVAFEHFE